MWWLVLDISELVLGPCCQESEILERILEGILEVILEGILWVTTHIDRILMSTARCTAPSRSNVSSSPSRYIERNGE